MNSVTHYVSFALVEWPTLLRYVHSKLVPKVWAPWGFLSLLIHDELQRRRDRLVTRRIKRAAFRDITTLDTFDWTFNPTIDRALIFELATGRYIERREDALLLGNPGVGKSHLAQALGMAAIHGGFHVLYRAAHTLFEELVLAEACGEREQAIATLCEIPLLIIDDVGMRKPPTSAAEDLLEIVMRRYERASTIITSNRPIEDWPKLFGDTPAVTAFLDRLMHHCHLIQIRGRVTDFTNPASSRGNERAPPSRKPRDVGLPDRTSYVYGALASRDASLRALDASAPHTSCKPHL